MSASDTLWRKLKEHTLLSTDGARVVIHFEGKRQAGACWGALCDYIEAMNTQSDLPRPRIPRRPTKATEAA